MNYSVTPAQRRLSGRTSKKNVFAYGEDTVAGQIPTTFVRDTLTDEDGFYRTFRLTSSTETPDSMSTGFAREDKGGDLLKY